MGLFSRKSKITAAVYPNICLACKKPVKNGESFCEECSPFIRRISHPTCDRCGRSKKRCLAQCQKPSYDFVCAPFYYKGAIRAALKRFKFSDRPRSAEFFGPEMADYIGKEHPDFKPDIVTYVPMTQKQVEIRRYNQSKLLAEQVAKALNIPVSDDILYKKYDIEPQHNLKSVYRAGNVMGAFDVKDKSLVEGKNVLVVDDIKTTGATLNECAKILKIYGAKEVGCVSAAIVI